MRKFEVHYLKGGSDNPRGLYHVEAQHFYIESGVAIFYNTVESNSNGSKVIERHCIAAYAGFLRVLEIEMVTPKLSSGPPEAL